MYINHETPCPVPYTVSVTAFILFIMGCRYPGTEESVDIGKLWMSLGIKKSGVDLYTSSHFCRTGHLALHQPATHRSTDVVQPDHTSHVACCHAGFLGLCHFGPSPPVDPTELTESRWVPWGSQGRTSHHVVNASKGYPLGYCTHCCPFTTVFAGLGVSPAPHPAQFRPTQYWGTP